MNKNEDIAWVTRCALFDDRRAFACLVDKYQVRLKRFFLNLTGGDPVLSDDLAQETFIKVYYNLRSYKGLSSFSTWIYRVAYNVFTMSYERAGNGKMLLWTRRPICWSNLLSVWTGISIYRELCLFYAPRSERR